jgi:imidazolonepropionase
MKLILKNIKGLVQAEKNSPTVKRGAEMSQLNVIENAWLVVEDGKFSDFGAMSDFQGVGDGANVEVVDCQGKYVFPSWVDSHTHIVYAGNREGEFVDRIKGLSYAEIAEKGGGILNSAAKLAAASEEELFEQAWHRLDSVMATGTGAVEIKSGYGLSVDAELKMLRVIRTLNEKHPLPIKATFLGAHAIPAKFKGNRVGYVDHVINEMIPAVASEGLADYVDIFCEEGYFDIDDTNRVLEAGVKHGLKPKTHVNQFKVLGGVAASVNHGAISVDHLEELEDQDIIALKGSSTIPVGLPLCSLFLSIPYTPGRRIIDAGLPLALATDFNPGSSPSGNMSLAVALGCIKMNLTPEESINAATINGAAALEMSETHGSISPGKAASFFITSAIPSHNFLPYSFGENLVESLYIDGVKRV